jgi:hypothetical protein
MLLSHSISFTFMKALTLRDINGSVADGLACGKLD